MTSQKRNFTRENVQYAVLAVAIVISIFAYYKFKNPGPKELTREQMLHRVEKNLEDSSGRYIVTEVTPKSGEKVEEVGIKFYIPEVNVPAENNVAFVTATLWSSKELAEKRQSRSSLCSRDGAWTICPFFPKLMSQHQKNVGRSLLWPNVLE